MDTTTAAQQAKVTVATIRTWCRIGAVAAAKKAGRWVIEAASLAYRVSLTKPAKKAVRFTVETMTAIGGNRWQRGDKDRVYLNDWASLIGLEVSRYNTGNISSAALNGEKISNSEAGRLLGSVDKVYFDNTDGKAHIQWGYGTPRTFGRDDLAQAIFGGIRAAIAAL
jgi:hypothetical protein